MLANHKPIKIYYIKIMCFLTLIPPFCIMSQKLIEYLKKDIVLNLGSLKKNATTKFLGFFTDLQSMNVVTYCKSILLLCTQLNYFALNLLF